MISEHELQCCCVAWFRYQHRQFAPLLFAVPNGGARNKATAGKLKAEGIVAGVSDLILLVPRGAFHGLCVEMKAAKGKQSPKQRQWQKAVEAQGYQYSLCKTYDEFITTMNQYLNQ